MMNAGRFAVFAVALTVGSLSRAGEPRREETGSAVLQEPQGEMREYIAEDGRRIVITSLGNLVGLESPRGFEHVAGGTDLPIEGYVLVYEDQTGTPRVLHNVYRSQSSTIKTNLPDFVPISFDGPQSGSEFPRGSVVGAKVVVGTRDGLVEIRTTFSWVGGIVRIESEVASVRRTIRLLAFKRQSRFPVDGGGPFGIQDSKFDVLTIEPPPVGEFFLGQAMVFSSALCCRRSCDPGLCPPKLQEFSEVTVNAHSVLFQAGPDAPGTRSRKPTYLTITDASDDCERMVRGACPSDPLPRERQDSVVTAGWLMRRKLQKDASLRFVTRATVY